MVHSKALRTLACLVLLGAAGVLAQEEEVPAPAVQTDHGIEYRSGGVGTDERDALFAAVKGYGLRLVFAAKDKSDYLADVSVGISDSAGKPIFAASDVGPYLFVHLSAGKYKVTATHGGQAQSKGMTVAKGKQASAGFYW